MIKWVFAALAFALGLGLGYARWHEPFDRYARDRWVNLQRAEDFPKGGVLLIGDSTAHRLHLPTLCGLPVFNAGMSGAKVEEIAPSIAPLTAKLRPAAVIVSMGQNNEGDWDNRLLEVLPPRAYVIGVYARDNRRLEARGRYIPPFTTSADGVHADAAGRREIKANLLKICDELDLSRKNITEHNLAP